MTLPLSPVTQMTPQMNKNFREMENPAGLRAND
jgi:hypothetical protein